MRIVQRWPEDEMHRCDAYFMTDPNPKQTVIERLAIIRITDSSLTFKGMEVIFVRKGGKRDNERKGV